MSNNTLLKKFSTSSLFGFNGCLLHVTSHLSFPHINKGFKPELFCNKKSTIGTRLGYIVDDQICRNPSLGLATKAKGLHGCGPRGSPRVKAKRSQGCGPRKNVGVTSHIPESVKKCEGI
jgi:hypothetical protein